jgi:hypothetical protein
MSRHFYAQEREVVGRLVDHAMEPISVCLLSTVSIILVYHVPLLHCLTQYYAIVLVFLASPTNSPMVTSNAAASRFKVVREGSALFRSMFDKKV